jgi:hypothetical protein
VYILLCETAVLLKIRKYWRIEEGKLHTPSLTHFRLKNFGVSELNSLSVK